MIGMLSQQIDNGLPIALSKDGNEETHELVDDVGFVKILNHGKVPFVFRKHQAKPTGYAVHWRHPQDCQDLSLDKRLVESPQMRSHVPHRDQTRK